MQLHRWCAVASIALAWVTLGSSMSPTVAELVYGVPPDKTEETVEVLRARLGEAAEVTTSEGGRITIALPDGADVSATRALVEAPGHLEFLLEATPADWGTTDPAKEKAKLLAWIEEHPEEPVSAWPTPSAERVVWARRDREGLPLDECIVALARSEKTEWRFTQVDILKCQPTRDDFGYPALGLELTESSGLAFGEFTKTCLRRQLGVVLDGHVLTLASIEEPLYGLFQVRSSPPGWEQEEVERMVTILRGGPLPGRLRFIEQRE